MRGEATAGSARLVVRDDRSPAHLRCALSSNRRLEASKGWYAETASGWHLILKEMTMAVAAIDRQVSVTATAALATVKMERSLQWWMHVAACTSPWL